MEVNPASSEKKGESEAEKKRIEEGQIKKWVTRRQERRQEKRRTENAETLENTQTA